jgi:ubiquinone biosynthesis protein
MDLSSIARIRRAPEQFRRYRDIVAVLARYGLADWTRKLPLGVGDFLSGGRAEKGHESTEIRIRKALGDLGPTFVKLGQFLSIRPDIVGVGLSQELQQLQDRAPADPADVIKKIVVDSLGEPLEDLFKEFDDEPMASASIAQVHKAVLHSGTEVAVKVQHVEVRRVVKADTDILTDLADLLEKHVPESRAYRPRALVSEFKKTITRELDFHRELHNMEAFRLHFEEEPRLCIPKTYNTLSTGRVLTMENLHGVKATDLEGIRALAVDSNEVASTGAELFLTMVFEHGLFHGDPHPGNLLVLEGGRIGLMDFGMVGRIDGDLGRDLEDLLIGVAQNDAKRIMYVLIRMGAAPADLDRSLFQAELNDLMAYYAEVPIGEIDVSDAMKEIMDAIRKHRIVLPPDLALLVKVILALDSTGRCLDPSFQIIDKILPYRRKILLKRLSPGRQLQKIQHVAEDVDQFIQTAPASVSEIVRQLEEGSFTVRMRVLGLEDTRKQLERSTNRLTYGILTGSIILASSLLVVMRVPPTVLGHSILGLAGYGISLFFALRLLWAIFRSGKLH